MIDDFSLIDKVVLGDENAFRLLVQRYQKQAMSVAIAVVKDNVLAEEVVQDSFVKVYVNIKKFSRHAKFSTWLYTIVTNEALMCLRKINRNRIKIVQDISSLISEGINVEVTLDKELVDALNKAIMTLSANEALVIRLFYLEEENIQTVSDITGWTVANVKTLLYRARKNLGKVLQSQMNKYDR